MYIYTTQFKAFEAVCCLLIVLTLLLPVMASTDNIMCTDHDWPEIYTHLTMLLQPCCKLVTRLCKLLQPGTKDCNMGPQAQP